MRAGGELQISSYTGEYVIDENGWIRFLTSGDLRVKNTTVIDAFLVGGGGSAARKMSSAASASRITPGGGGGYTVTKKGVTLYPHKKYGIVIGAGGRYYVSTSLALDGEDGGATSAFGLIAEGGKGGQIAESSDLPEDRVTKGGDGGSGGGAIGGEVRVDNVSTLHIHKGGVDGADGEECESKAGGAGQGRTTRAFEEENGELFASGGDGGYNAGFEPETQPDPQDGAANTGDGGDGGCAWSYATSWNPTVSTTRSGKSGGSGIVIIRKAVES